MCPVSSTPTAIWKWTSTAAGRGCGRRPDAGRGGAALLLPGSSSPKGGNYNNTDLYLAATYANYTLKYSYTPGDFFSTPDSKGTWYLDGTANFDLGDGWGLVGHLGYQKLKNQTNMNGDSISHYVDYKLGVTKDLKGWVLGLAAVGATKDNWLPTKYGHPSGRLGRCSRWRAASEGPKAAGGAPRRTRADGGPARAAAALPPLALQCAVACNPGPRKMSDVLNIESLDLEARGIAAARARSCSWRAPCRANAWWPPPCAASPPMKSPASRRSCVRPRSAWCRAARILASVAAVPCSTWSPAPRWRSSSVRWRTPSGTSASSVPRACCRPAGPDLGLPLPRPPVGAGGAEEGRRAGGLP